MMRGRGPPLAANCATTARAGSFGGGEADLALAGGQREVGLGEQLGVEQRAVQVAMRVVDAEPAAQRIERIALAGETLAREFERVLDVAAIAHAPQVRADCGPSS
jgi:hypothetical protein